VAAYGIIMYFTWIFVSLYLGYSVGVSPVVSFHFGAQNHQEVSSLLRKSLMVMAILGVSVVLMAQTTAPALARIFVGYDLDLMQLTIHGFRIYSLHFLVTGLNIYASSFFTSLNNGPVSALISMSRTIIFECGCVLLLPLIFGMEGIWWAVVVAECLSAILSIVLLLTHRSRYGYHFLNLSV
jgi:Na+-driven multidrug efflux pump